jgi:hypothetical protein
MNKQMIKSRRVKYVSKKHRGLKKKRVSKKKYPFPKKYYTGLSAKNKIEQIKELKRSRELYKKGIYVSRSKKSSFNSKRSPHIVEFEKKYRVNIANKKAVFKATGIKPAAQEKILNKGRGAFYSSGSRPNQSGESWALARLASVILKHGAYKVDRHVLKEYDCNNIKKPSTISNTNDTGVVSCSKITDDNQKKYKKCKRDSDGKFFDLPRKYSPSKCSKPKGFTMKSSCTPFTSK